MQQALCGSELFVTIAVVTLQLIRMCIPLKFNLFDALRVLTLGNTHLLIDSWFHEVTTVLA